MEEFRWWTNRPYLNIETSRGGRTTARTVKMKIMLGLRLIDVMTAGRTAHFHFDNAAAAVLLLLLATPLIVFGILLLGAHGTG